MANNYGNQAFRAGIWYTISTISVKAMAILTTPIFTRLLTTEDYGISATFNSWYSLMYIICSLDLDMSVGRAKQDIGESLEKYVGSLQLLSGLFTGILFIFSIIFRELLLELIELDTILLLMLYVYLFFSTSVSLMQTRLRYEYRYKENIGIMFYITLTTVLLSIFLIKNMEHNRYWGKVIGTVIPTTILGLFFWGRGFYNKNIHLNKEYWNYALKISAPMIIHSLSLNVLATADRVVITKFLGAKETGIYTLVYQYAIIINLIMGAVNHAWQPWFHDNYHAGKFSLIKSRAKDISLLGGIIGLGCVAFGPEMISILGPVEYQNGLTVLVPLVMGIVCQFVYSNYINVELHLKQTKYASLCTVIAAVLNMLLNIIYVPQYGYFAAAYTTLISYIVLLFGHYYITKYILKVVLYDDIFFLKFLIGVMSLCMLFSLLYSMFYIRLILISMFCILFIFKYKKYLNII